MTPTETIDDQLCDLHASWLRNIWRLNVTGARLDDLAIDKLLEKRYWITSGQDPDEWPQ